jgi:hypothetical protein
MRQNRPFRRTWQTFAAVCGVSPQQGFSPQLAAEVAFLPTVFSLASLDINYHR